MSSAPIRVFRPGLRARLTLWTSAVLAAASGLGFAWVHHGLRATLEAKNDAFLASKGEELAAVLLDAHSGGDEALDAEIRREVAAYEGEGLVVVVRRPGATVIAPPTPSARGLADRLAALGAIPVPRTIGLSGSRETYRVLRIELVPPNGPVHPLDLALSLSETESILAQFDRRAAAGALVFLVLAVAGGLLLSWQALRPVDRSITIARQLNPSDLSARLPRTGSNDELDRLAGTINDLLDRLAVDHAQVIRFTADASHELRSPLSAMRAAVEVTLQQRRTADEYREVLGSLGEQCDRLTALVNGLLTLARADAGEVELKHDPLDLATLAVEVAEMYQPLAEERGLELTWDAASRLPVRGDAPRLRQLITNLLDNAIKFTDPGGRVSVQAGRDGQQARLLVSDTGVGIPDDRLPHIFERFYQVDPARSSTGSGLGLSISRWIAEAHGGSIGVASGPGRGSTFTVTLPTSADGDQAGGGGHG